MTMWLTEGILDGSVQARQPQTQQGKARAHGPIRKKPMWINVFELARKKKRSRLLDYTWQLAPLNSVTHGAHKPDPNIATALWAQLMAGPVVRRERITLVR
jgi:hypothetical protein